MKIGLGITTYNRPQLFQQSIASVMEILEPLVDHIVIYNDGSDKMYQEQYEAIYSQLNSPKIKIYKVWMNHGVAHSKNKIMQYLLKNDCDFIFIMEDDVIIMDKRAVLGYIDVYNLTKIEHLNFAHHGTLNPKPVVKDPPLVYWPNLVGAWSFYTRHCLETVGLLDENFYNAWEHVEHTKRIAQAGLTSPFWYFADVAQSANWIKELPEAITTSQIRNDNNWNTYIQNGMTYWKMKDKQGLPPHPTELLQKPWKWEE